MNAGVVPLLLLAAVAIAQMTSRSLAQQHVVFAAYGTASEDRLGISVCGVGDIDRDGWRDCALGAYQEGSSVGRTGYVRVVSGRDGRALHTIRGDSPGDAFGWSVAGVGDVNGDGYPDLLIGACMAQSTGTGYARLVSGRDGSTLFTFRGANTGDYFGWSVTGLEDLDADGSPEIAIGALQPSTTGHGYVDVFSGRTGKQVTRLVGDAAADRFGASIVNAGDIDGDKTGDLLVGACYVQGQPVRPGYARVFSGKTLRAVLTVRPPSHLAYSFGEAVSGVGDLDADGTNDIAVSATGDRNLQDVQAGTVRTYSGRTGTELRVLYGGGWGARFGTAIAGGRDLDGDKVPDLLVSAPDDGPGHVYVISGRTSNVVFRFSGASSQARFGWSLALPGDLDQDSHEDLLVGSLQDDTTARDAGCALGLRLIPANYTLFGKACRGASTLLPALGHVGWPVLGQRLELTLNRQRPLTGVILFLGFSPAAFDLTGLGAPGCIVNANPHVSFVYITDLNGDLFPKPSFSIPMDLSLIRAAFYNQFLVVERSANMLGLIVSEAGRADIGMYAR